MRYGAVYTAVCDSTAFSDEVYTNIMSEPVRVSPDMTVQVPLSSLDVNRITCMGGAPVKDVAFSQKNGITTKINGSNVFLKLQKQQDPSTLKVKTVREPIDLYVVCGQDQAVYTVIGTPKKIPAQWIQLESKKSDIERTLSMFKGIPFEKKLLTIMKQTYFGEYPDFYQVDVKNESIAITCLEWLNIRLIRDIAIEGEGLRIKAFDLRIHESATFDEKKVMESFFILPELSENPVSYNGTPATLTSYCLINSSLVTITMFSTIACAISIRSNGSL